MGVRRAVTLASIGLTLAVRAASAQSETDPPRLEQAKEQFRLGVALLNAGDTAGALTDFQRSRELRPSGRNTVNAAICMEQLGRYDEALELYETVLANFAADLEQEDRENLGPVMESLRAKLSYVELSANVAGDVTVAGRARGRLPFKTALRVLPGQQTIRILKDGYRPFEAGIDLVAGQTQRLSAKLEPLADSPVPLRPEMPKPATDLSAPAAPRSPDRDVRRALGWSLGAAGVAQLGVAGYFGVRAVQKHGQKQDVDAGSSADVSTVFSITGLATTAVGVFLLLTSAKAPAASPARARSFGVALDKGNTLEFYGRF